jgi:ankyrin repeat protein
MSTAAIRRTPLDRAACQGHPDVVRLLIERGAEVDSRDERRWTPLHFASRYGQLEVSRVLVDHGADVNARQRYHCIPMPFSAEFGHLRIVKLLLERGADIDAPDGSGQTPYNVASKRISRCCKFTPGAWCGQRKVRGNPFMAQMRCLTGTSILVLSDSAT